MRAHIPLLLVSLSMASACGYRDCGTMNYWIDHDDPRFDRDGDRYLDLMEACGVDYGSFGYHSPSRPESMMMISDSQWDMGDAVDIAYDYLPATEVRFPTDRLVEGAVLTGTDLSGFGLHIYQGDSNESPAQAPLTSGTIEVLKGPRSGYMDREEWRLRWDLSYGDVSPERPLGYQHHTGEDWVGFEVWEY